MIQAGTSTFALAADQDMRPDPYERARLLALHEYDLLDSPAEDELEAVVRIAAMVAGVPTATLNLIDENRQCQLTTVGFPGADSPRSDSMCAVQFRSGAVVCVPDASQHPLYADNPWVTGALATVRFYASAPLITPTGHALGTLCVFDSRPKELTGEQVARLADLAGIVVALFERRRQARLNAALAAEADARRAFIQTVLETIDVAIVAADSTGHLTLFNRASREWHGMDADPTLDPGGFADRYALYRADGHTPLPTDEIPLLRALRDGAVHDEELIIQPHGRAAIQVVARGRALHAADGTPLGAVVAMADVTADRAQQRALREAHATVADQQRQLAATVADLKRSNAELEHFAGVVSHDLLAPLGAVNGYLELLEDALAHDPGPDQPRNDDVARPRQWIEAASRAVTRMSGLISGLLGHARAGNGAWQPQPVALRPIVEDVLHDIAVPLDEAGARVKVAEALPTVTGDPTLLRQLLQNLLCNALKYRRPDRDCRITVTAVAEASGGHRVAVADNGIGIPAEHRERIFEIFAQLDPGRAGEGIGLSTCHRIVTRHGGRIWAEETPGGGATLHFTMPNG